MTVYSSTVKRFGAIEIGGTKTLVAAAESVDDLADHRRIPTTTPDETLEEVIGELESAGVDAVGVASFGPVELRPGHPRYGYITSTPKPDWSDTPVVQIFVERLGVPVGFDVDVNGAALGEGRWGAAAGMDDFAYITVGTGIGGGVVVAGSPVHGAPHPEVGHVVVRRHPDDDYPGSCPFHGDCLEGLAAGPAVEARFGRPGNELSGSEIEQAVELVTFYLAQGFRNLVYAVAPARLVVGGGISKMHGFHETVRGSLTAELAGYPYEEAHLAPEFVVPPDLGDMSGLAGALILAERQSV